MNWVETQQWSQTNTTRWREEHPNERFTKEIADAILASSYSKNFWHNLTCFCLLIIALVLIFHTLLMYGNYNYDISVGADPWARIRK